MAKFSDIVDVKPTMESVTDLKSSGEAVLDIKPSMLLVERETEDYQAIELGKGMSRGPGWFMYVTYPTTNYVKF